MAKSKLKEQEAQQKEKIEATVSKTEQFLNENKKTIWICVFAVIIIGLGILAYNKFYYKPKAAEAQEQMYPAEASFRAGEFELALKGDGNALGFEQIINDYGAKGGKAVYFYAGICELQLGNYENAISYLQKYNGKEDILAARAIACTGDAYVGLEDYQSALNCFKKAAGKADNVFAASYLLKAGAVCEKLGDKAQALTFYEKIKDQYPQSVEGYDIDKYINRVKGE